MNASLLIAALLASPAASDVSDADGADAISLPFSRIWQAFASGPTRSVGTAWELLAKGLSAGERLAGEDALRHNTLLAPRPAVAFELPARPAW